jgi:hypothetical protein
MTLRESNNDYHIAFQILPSGFIISHHQPFMSKNALIHGPLNIFDKGPHPFILGSFAGSMRKNTKWSTRMQNECNMRSMVRCHLDTN